MFASLRSFRLPRMTFWWLVALVLLVLVLLTAPQQLPVTLYKFSLVSLAVVVGFGLDNSLFPYARPSSYLQYDWRRSITLKSNSEADHPIIEGCESVFAVAMLRRAIIIGAVVLAVALGL